MAELEHQETAATVDRQLSSHFLTADSQTALVRPSVHATCRRERDRFDRLLVYGECHEAGQTFDLRSVSEGPAVCRSPLSARLCLERDRTMGAIVG